MPVVLPVTTPVEAGPGVAALISTVARSAELLGEMENTLWIHYPPDDVQRPSAILPDDGGGRMRGVRDEHARRAPYLYRMNGGI